MTVSPSFAYDHGDYAAEIDTNFAAVNAKLTSLDKQRDALANVIKAELYAAGNFGVPVIGAGLQTGTANKLIAAAKSLAASS